MLDKIILLSGLCVSGWVVCGTWRRSNTFTVKTYPFLYEREAEYIIPLSLSLYFLVGRGF